MGSVPPIPPGLYVVTPAATGDGRRAPVAPLPPRTADWPVDTYEPSSARPRLPTVTYSPGKT